MGANSEQTQRLEEPGPAPQGDGTWPPPQDCGDREDLGSTSRGLSPHFLHCEVSSQTRGNAVWTPCRWTRHRHGWGPHSGPRDEPPSRPPKDLGAEFLLLGSRARSPPTRASLRGHTWWGTRTPALLGETSHLTDGRSHPHRRRGHRPPPTGVGVQGVGHSSGPLPPRCGARPELGPTCSSACGDRRQRAAEPGVHGAATCTRGHYFNRNNALTGV